MASPPEEATISYQDGEQQHLLPNSGKRRKMSVDDAIEQLGMGKFQYLMLLVTGLCFGSDAVEITLLSFLSPTLEAEWNLQPWQSSTITAVVFFGNFLGSLIFGRLGDIFGRRPAFLCGAFTIAIFGFATSLANDFVTLSVVRFVVGMGVGGMIVAFDILAEFLPTNRRGRLLAMIEFFYTFGSMYVPLAAAATLARSWRILVSICAVPCFVSAVLGLFMLPESPRWLVAKGHKEEALQILQRVAKMNGPDPQALSNLDLQDEEPESSDIKKLFKPKWRKLTLLIWGVWGGLGICYFAAVILITRIFESTNLEDSSQVDKQECESEGTACSNDAASFDFTAIFVSSSAEVVAVVLLIALIDRVGRVPTQAVSYSSAGITIATLCLLAAANTKGTMTHAWMVLLLAYILRVFEMMGSAATYITTAELLPTEIRTTGHSAAYAVSRLGATLSPYIVSSHTPLAWSAIILLVAHVATSVCSAQLPETNRQSLGKANFNNTHGTTTDLLQQNTPAMSLAPHSARGVTV